MTLTDAKRYISPHKSPLQLRLRTAPFSNFFLARGHFAFLRNLLESRRGSLVHGSAILQTAPSVRREVCIKIAMI